MEKTIMLGCVDATAWGYSPNARAIAYVTVKYEEKKGQKVFSAAGKVKMGGHVIMAGQCLDELKDMIDKFEPPHTRDFSRGRFTKRRLNEEGENLSWKSN